MADASSTLGRALLSFSETRDIDEFVDMLSRFERGAIDADAWRAFRLLRGTYGQRQPGSVSMLRAKIPQGVVSASQLESLADVADRFSRGFCHLTTRQNVQFHFVPLEQMAEAMHVLAAAGITTREACGNSVRNVTTSANAGVAADEAFDPTPYARAFTRHFLRHPLSSSLPRKFKVAFSGGGEDHANVLVNDLGFTACVRDGVRGFRVTAGGGTALMCTSARELLAFVPADELLGIAEAVVRVFHARGDREHRKKNRMKFLVKQLGWDAFRALVLGELATLPSVKLELDSHVEGPPERRASWPRPAEIEALVARDAPRGPGIVPRHLPVLGDPGLDRFVRTNVRAQKQDGFTIVTIVVPLGDLTSGRLRALAALARSYGDGTVRATASQNLTLRWVPSDRVAQLHAHLGRIGLAEPDPDSLADVSSCPGAESCKLAVTQSRGLASTLGERFRADRRWVDRAPGLVVRVSGCPNGCGLHHVASIGFQGGLRKVGGRAVPQYFVYAGGDASVDGTARFGRVIGKVPARRVVTVIERLVETYERNRRDGEGVTAYLGRAPAKELSAAIADLTVLDEADARDEDFVDLGETTAFAPETTEGECAA